MSDLISPQAHPVVAAAAGVVQATGVGAGYVAGSPLLVMASSAAAVMIVCGPKAGDVVIEGFLRPVICSLGSRLSRWIDPEPPHVQGATVREPKSKKSKRRGSGA